ncbi:hypothetical protein [Hafnia alvei]|uniref:hypothetical protein n=1 Tax=Hafnia alvei TaxID=569 RepID=UPI00061D0398|nr:hypothetical protein [Hafnia alvei]KKF38912.1 hypothetical protein PU01_20465 [Hafnia alvei]
MAKNIQYLQSTQHLSPDANKRLHRSHVISFWLSTELPQREYGEPIPLWLSSLFSYIADDISGIKQELKDKGLLYPAQPK